MPSFATKEGIVVKVKGRIQSVSLSGDGMNAAELRVKLKKRGETYALRAGTPPATSPQMFTSLTTAVTAAHLRGAKVRFDVSPDSNGSLRILGLRL